MSALVRPGTWRTATVDSQNVEDAVALIAPKWTARVVQTLAQQPEPTSVPVRRG